MKVVTQKKNMVALKELKSGDVFCIEDSRIMMRLHPYDFKPYDDQKHLDKICVCDLTTGSAWFMHESRMVQKLEATCYTIERE